MLKNKMSKIMSKYHQKKCQKPRCEKECQNCVKKNIKNKNVKNKNVKNTVLKSVKQYVRNQNIKNYILQSVQKNVKNKVSKRMSKWCRKKCRTPECQKECQNDIKKNIKHFSFEKVLKKVSKSTPYFGSMKDFNFTMTIYSIMHSEQPEFLRSLFGARKLKREFQKESHSNIIFLSSNFKQDQH
jgi:hypothetical protein